MSRATIAAKRYAKALFEVAREQQKISEIEQELKLVLDVLHTTPEFQKLLQHPKITTSVKQDLLKQAFSGKIGEVVLNILHLLVERRREHILDALYKYYTDIANEALGQAYATVYSSLPLQEEQAKQLADQFGKLIGKQIKLNNVIDESVIGGLQVRIGDRLYDGSVSGKLARLHRALQQSQAL